MGKGEASSAVGRGSDGTGGGNALRGKDLLSHLRGLESTVSVVTEAQERAIWERSAQGFWWLLGGASRNSLRAGIRSRVEGDMATERSGGPSGSRRPGFAVE